MRKSVTDQKQILALTCGLRQLKLSFLCRLPNAAISGYTLSLVLSLAAFGLLRSTPALSQTAAAKTCPSTVVTGFIESPKELRSHGGRLAVSLSLRNSLDSAGRMQYCYVDDAGDRSPTLRLRPGDLLILTLKNQLTIGSSTHRRREHVRFSCAASAMMPGVTNLHFHGLSIPPSCHADDSLRTSISSSQSFTYRFRIPSNQSPGLYWYHAHPHGDSEEQLLGGASGALIIDGISAANTPRAGLPERVFIIRDQRLQSATPLASNHDPSIPAKDLSLNFISIPYPEYPVPTIKTSPGRRELWRVLNASADTYVNLGVLFNGEWKDSGLAATNGSWQSLALVAVDGVPISEPNSGQGRIEQRSEIPIPPGGRAEFIFLTPPEGVKAELITAGAETTPPDDEDKPVSSNSHLILDHDDYTPPRPLARIVSSHLTLEPTVSVEATLPRNQNRIAPLATVAPARQRKFYFSEEITDPKAPGIPAVYYITEEGRVPKAFDPSNLAPDVIVHQGDVEDWTIENRSLESHAFHIHQAHFLVTMRNGIPLSHDYLADTVDVPYWDGSTSPFPSVTLRMDFRDPKIVGIFPYHCHILQHADRGMMGIVELRPKQSGKNSAH